ncbi:TPA: conjugal transfer protein TraF, partial [Klebsiella pneumoniae]|nr:conjugal transfer protein TraF [Klebsiella pneumoniae]
MKKHFKFSVVSIAVSLFMANQAGAANTWTESRSDAMGGTGVASGSYGSGALINPALLAKAKPDDDVTVILPSVGVQVTDEDNLQDEIDTINDKINHYKDVVDSLTPIEVITNPLGSINQFQGAAKDLADELDYLKGKTARATAGAGIAVSIPNDVLSVA